MPQPTTPSRRAGRSTSPAPDRRAGPRERRRGRDRRGQEPADRLLAALRELEHAVEACPPGARRRAAVELVVSRVRRLVRRRPATRAEARQIDLEELLAGRARG